METHPTRSRDRLCLLAPTLCGIKHRFYIKSEFIQLCVEDQIGVAAVKCVYTATLCSRCRIIVPSLSIWIAFLFLFFRQPNVEKSLAPAAQAPFSWLNGILLESRTTKHSDWKLWVTLTFVHVAVFTASSWGGIRKHLKACFVCCRRLE